MTKDTQGNGDQDPECQLFTGSSSGTGQEFPKRFFYGVLYVCAQPANAALGAAEGQGAVSNKGSWLPGEMEEPGTNE